MYALCGVMRGQLGDAHQTWLATTLPEDQQACEVALQRTIRDGENYEIELRVVWPDGTLRYLRADGQVQRDAQGRPLRESVGLGVSLLTILALNVVLAPAFGGIGAAWASTIGFTTGGVAIAILFLRELDAQPRDLLPGRADARLLFVGLRRSALSGLRRLRAARAT